MDENDCHIGTVTQSRLGFLREHNADCLYRLKQWVRVAHKEEADKACLSRSARRRIMCCRKSQGQTS